MPQSFNQAQYIADRFGGAAALADAIGVPQHQTQDWCRRSKFIPEKHRKAVLAAAEQRGLFVNAFDFVRHLVKLAD